MKEADLSRLECNYMKMIRWMCKESKSVGLEREDAMNRATWRVGVGEMLLPVEWGKCGHPRLRE